MCDNNYEFREGDKVEYIGQSTNAFEKGKVYTVDRVSRGKYLYPKEFANYGWNQAVSAFRLVKKKYPYPPHPHAEVIKAWADGAEIELKLPNGDWFDNSVSPSFCVSRQYRIKPEKSEKQLKIEELEKKARELADEIATLKGE